jgi:hypothetical protein
LFSTAYFNSGEPLLFKAAKYVDSSYAAFVFQHRKSILIHLKASALMIVLCGFPLLFCCS